MCCRRVFSIPPHNYAVYVPAQYDAKRPTAFMVFLDGNGYLGDGIRVPVVLDNLIARHELPPMIGIFVDPGSCRRFRLRCRTGLSVCLNMIP
jgi:enterochelin esterase-like enzyme